MNPAETNHAAQLSTEKILKQILNEHFSTRELESQENNNSFLFLEKSSLHLLLSYLLTDIKKEPSPAINEKPEWRLLEKTKEILEENEKEFKAIIQLLKNER